MTAITVGIREAKMHLSRYMHNVRQGQEIILTDRGRPVGRIIPFQQEELTLSARLQQLEDSGLLDAARPAKEIAIPAPLQVPDNMAQRMLEEDREA